jgi:hypothetical protein
MTTTADTTPFSTVIGVFPTHEQADQAIDALRAAKFSYERIRIVERGKGGFADTLKGLFTGQAEVAASATDDLVKMGMPDYEAQYYQRELDAQRVLLLINADDRPEEAFNIMRQNGAFDLQSRLRIPEGNGRMTQPDTSQSQMRFDQNAPSNTTDSNTTSSATDSDLARQRHESNIPPIPADNVDVKPAYQQEEEPSPPTSDQREEEQAPDQ